MDAPSQETSSGGQASLLTIHGFRVQSYGKDVPSKLRKALKRLSDKGFADSGCVVVKTPKGPCSGITHAGGRYVSPRGTCRDELMQKMRGLGMEPPSPPFLVMAGASDLYHEWGHHVDYMWSRDSQTFGFSFCWLSHYYQVGAKPSRIADTVHDFRADCPEFRPIESYFDATQGAAWWWHVSPELFADLFDHWTREQDTAACEECEPRNLRFRAIRDETDARITLLPGVRAEDVRNETWRLFAAGIRFVVDFPPIRSGLFGVYTDDAIRFLRDQLSQPQATQVIR